MTDVISWAQYDRLPATEQNRFAQVRAPDGGTVWKLRTDLPSPDAVARLSDAEYEKLPMGARFNYARQFSQNNGR